MESVCFPGLVDGAFHIRLATHCGLRLFVVTGVKLLILHSELGVLRGGGENFTRNLFTVMTKRGHEVSAAFAAGVSGRYPVPLPEGIKPIPVRGWWSRKPGQAALSFVARFVPKETTAGRAWRRMMGSMEWRGARWHDRRFHRRIQKEFADRWKDFDAIYVHSNAELAAEVSKHRPTVLRLPGPATAEQAPLLQAVPVVCANGDVLARTKSLIGDGVVELPVGLDFASFSPTGGSVRPSLGLTEKHKVIGYVGRLTRLKGVDLLAEAFHQIAAVIPEARLILIGRGEEEGSVRHVLAKEIADGRVHLVPTLTSAELGSWYRAMDVFVLPSRYENFSNALLEAAACGAPFIASDVGGNRMFQTSGCGLLFAPGSVDDLVRQMREFFGDMETSRSRSLAFSRVVRERYDWNVSADRMEWILQSRLTPKASQAAGREQALRA